MCAGMHLNKYALVFWMRVRVRSFRLKLNANACYTVYFTFPCIWYIEYIACYVYSRACICTWIKLICSVSFG